MVVFDLIWFNIGSGTVAMIKLFMIASSVAHCCLGDWLLTMLVIKYVAGNVVEVRWLLQPHKLNVWIM